jgi:gas vesicle protein
MTSNTKIILGLFAAAAAGAAMGVLLAPEKGSELRRKIKESVDGVVDDVCELLAIGKDELAQRFGEAKEEAATMKDTVTEGYNRMHGSNS